WLLCYVRRLPIVMPDHLADGLLVVLLVVLALLVLLVLLVRAFGRDASVAPGHALLRRGGQG
ncbi:hypothetical protein, partial [Streptomyces telluris]